MLLLWFLQLQKNTILQLYFDAGALLFIVPVNQTGRTALEDTALGAKEGGRDLLSVLT